MLIVAKHTTPDHHWPDWQTYISSALGYKNCTRLTKRHHQLLILKKLFKINRKCPHRTIKKYEEIAIMEIIQLFHRSMKCRCESHQCIVGSHAISELNWEWSLEVHDYSSWNFSLKKCTSSYIFIKYEPFFIISNLTKKNYRNLTNRVFYKMW